MFNPIRDLVFATKSTLTCFESLLDEHGYLGLAAAMTSLIVWWFVYVPVHELLHVAAVYVTGGSVETLALKAMYGGELLQPIFPFIEPESDYAGQLTGFSVPNDWAYAFVDFLPYVLSLFGLPLMLWLRRKAFAVKASLFGLSMILMFIPLFAIIGDYYEAVSLALDPTARLISSNLPPRILISDDWFKLWTVLGDAGMLNALTAVFAVLGLLLALALALGTISLQVRLAALFLGPASTDETGELSTEHHGTSRSSD